MIQQAWLPIFQRFEEQPEPSWESFTRLYASYMPCCSMELSDITGAEMRQVLRRMGGAPGVDGWRVGELKALPLALLDRLAEVFNFIERHGRWPSVLERGLVCLIPEGGVALPTDMRPISVMSAAYQL